MLSWVLGLFGNWTGVDFLAIGGILSVGLRVINLLQIFLQGVDALLKERMNQTPSSLDNKAEAILLVVLGGLSKIIVVLNKLIGFLVPR